jgi:hypothetical protein
MLEIYGRTMLLTGDARGDYILEGLQNGGYLTASKPAHVDLLKLPHWGSTGGLTAGFFEQVTADHYVIAGHARFDLPKPDVLEMIAASRGSDEFHVHVSVDGDGAAQTARLQEAFARRTAAGAKGTLHFRPDGARSHLIDLAEAVTY